jgi:hypothetical protein
LTHVIFLFENVASKFNLYRYTSSRAHPAAAAAAAAVGLITCLQSSMYVSLITAVLKLLTTTEATTLLPLKPQVKRKECEHGLSPSMTPAVASR